MMAPSGKDRPDVFDAGGRAQVMSIDHRRERAQADFRQWELEKIADEIIAANAQQGRFRSGKEKAFNSLVGQVI